MSFDIGAKLKQERASLGVTLEDVSRDTRIAPRFLKAIEAGDFAQLPGLLFTRNFVRQYALALKLDPDPLLAELPRQDESTVQLPDPPARARSSYHRDRAMRSLVTSFAWILLAGGAGFAAYVHFNHTLQSANVAANRNPTGSSKSAAVNGNNAADSAPLNAPPPVTAATPDPVADAQPQKASAAAPQAAPASAPQLAGIQTAAPPAAAPASTASSAPVHVSMTAHQASWVQITADGKPAFTGTLQSNETRQISATEQVKILTGNAGGLTISLNGRTLDPLGPSGQIRTVRLTAEGPQFSSKAPQPAYDPL